LRYIDEGQAVEIPGARRFGSSDPYEQDGNYSWWFVDFNPTSEVFLFDRLLILRENLERLEDTAKQEKSRTGESYHSDRLQTLLKASEKFWRNADHKEKDTHPKNSDVEAWLFEHGFSSERLAKAGASIIRPEWAEVGRKPK
jgi:hypothetical protein